MKKQIELIIFWLKEVNSILDTCSDDIMPFEQANVIARSMYKPIGKLCFFDPDDLDAYRMSIGISSQSEIDSEVEGYLANI